MKTLFRFMLAGLLLTALSFAETALVKRNVTLRPSASTDNDAIMTIATGRRVTLLSTHKTNGYLSVTINKQRGWVWARNVEIEESPDEETEGQSVTAAPSATGVDTCRSSAEVPFNRAGPRELYPDPMKTPGCAATLAVNDLTKRWTENCPSGKADCTYSQSHRSVSKNERTFVYDQYQVPSNKRNIDNGEIDHFYPLCAGGSNSANNLWYQPIKNAWNGKNFGFKEKDRLEAWICKQITIHMLNPQEAFDRMTKDWVSFYLDAIVGDDEVNEQTNDDEQQ